MVDFLGVWRGSLLLKGFPKSPLAGVALNLAAP